NPVCDGWQHAQHAGRGMEAKGLTGDALDEGGVRLPGNRADKKRGAREPMWGAESAGQELQAADRLPVFAPRQLLRVDGLVGRHDVLLAMVDLELPFDVLENGGVARWRAQAPPTSFA